LGVLLITKTEIYLIMVKETSMVLNPAEKDAVQRATNMQGCSTIINAGVVIAMVLMAKHQSLTAS